MKLTILEIYEEDHGCEGLMPGEELMDMVYVRDEQGEQRWIRIPDSQAKDLNPGDILEE